MRPTTPQAPVNAQAPVFMGGYFSLKCLAAKADRTRRAAWAEFLFAGLTRARARARAHAREVVIFSPKRPLVKIESVFFWIATTWHSSFGSIMCPLYARPSARAKPRGISPRFYGSFHGQIKCGRQKPEITLVNLASNKVDEVDT